MRRKDLPFFVAQEGEEEHAAQFAEESGIVSYDDGYDEEIKKYSERHVWLTNLYDPYIHETALYHRTEKKWTFIQAFSASRNPIKSIMSSSLTRRYIYRCGPEKDNYRLILSIVNDLKERPDIRFGDFVWEIAHDQFQALQEHYLKEIKLLQLYAIQEYGALTNNEDVMWISDELNGSLFSSWNEFYNGVLLLEPEIKTRIIDAAQKRETFFPLGEDLETESNFDECVVE